MTPGASATTGDAGRAGALRVLVVVGSQQKGFLISLGRHISREHQVFFTASDQNVAAIIGRLAPELSGNVEVVPGRFSVEEKPDTMARAAEVEARYGVRLSMLLSYDRALGRGYIFNADRYPRIARSSWPQARKLEFLLERFARAERLFDRYRPDLIIGLQKDEVMNILAKARGVAYFSPSPAKIGNRYFWSDDEYLTSAAFLESIAENLGRGADALPPVEGYDQDVGSKFNHAKLRFTWTRACKEALRHAYKETKALVRGNRKKDSYPYLGWLPYLFRRPYIYDFFKRRGLSPAQLAGRRLVYVPLHLEPEIALLAIAPEFNNSMEMIAWISKALPADTLLVVKEQPFSFGVRSRRYYEQLLEISNVVLAHPETTSWEWIKASAVTATITGTAGTEAVMFNRPVLSFGQHQAVNLLPTVRVCTDFASTAAGVDELLALSPQDPRLEMSRRALYHAQLSTSFELDGFERTDSGLTLEDGLAGQALDALRLCFPAIGTSRDRAGAA